jgi:hypothetical protein
LDTFFFLQVDLVNDPGTSEEFLVCGLYVERLHALSAAIAIREMVMASPVRQRNDEVHIHLLEILFHPDGSRTEITRDLVEIIHREVNASSQSV